MSSDPAEQSSPASPPAEQVLPPGGSAGDPLTPVSATPSLPSDQIQIKRGHFYALLVTIGLAAGLGLGYLFWGRAGPSPATAGVSDTAGRIEVEVGDDPRIGREDAPIVIIEFSDFNCPYCRHWHQQTFPQLMQTYADEILFVYKDFPVVGGGSVGVAAAQAANCAQEQDRYWEFHDALLSGAFSLDRAGFEAAAIQVGIGPSDLLACLDSGKYAAEVTEDLHYGAGLGITGTPTFFINGIPMVGAQPLLRFIEIINGELG